MVIKQQLLVANCAESLGGEAELETMQSSI